MNIWYFVGAIELLVAVLKGLIYFQTGSTVDLGLAISGLVLAGLFFAIAKDGRKK